MAASCFPLASHASGEDGGVGGVPFFSYLGPWSLRPDEPHACDRGSREAI